MFRKIIPILVIAFTAANTISAQGDYHFGVQASPTFSWMTNDNLKINGNGSLLGLKLGLIVEKRYSDNIAVSTGIAFHFNAGGKMLYDQAGNFWKNSIPNATIPYTAQDTFQAGTELTYSIRYIEIPFGLRLRTQEFGLFRYYVEPQLMFDFRSNAKGTIRNSTQYDQDKIDITPDVNWFSMAWGLGGGIEYLIANNTTLIAGIYYQQGFINVQSSGNTLFVPSTTTPITTVAKADNSSSTVNAITIRLGVLF